MAGIIKPRKRARTVRTDDIWGTIRHNLATYDWAREMATKHAYAGLSDEKIYSLMPTSRIKWVGLANEHAGCPVHGAEIKVKGPDARYCWVLDPVNHPYKLKCSVEEEFYPSNDFGAGDLTSGDFPDDGTGLLINGQRYYILGEYCHRAYIMYIEPAMGALAAMYEQTGDLSYARKAALILYRIAEEYPNSTDRRDRCYDGQYGVYSGMLTDRIWSSDALRNDALVYDIIYDALDQDPRIVGFISQHDPDIDSPDAYRVFIEEHLLAPGMQAHFDRAISPNVGFVQRSMTTVAAVLDDFSDRRPNSRDVIEWLYEEAPGPERYFFPNMMQKDGSSFESPTYEAICRSVMIEGGLIMEQFRKRRSDELPLAEFPDLVHDDRMQDMLRHHAALVCVGRFPIPIADGGGDTHIPNPDRPQIYSLVYPDMMDLAYREFGVPDYARALIRPDGSIFHSLERVPLDDRILADAREAAARAQAQACSEVRDGYKVAIMRRGKGDQSGAVAVFYGAARTHAHNDPLNLFLYSRGQDLMPALGYPKSWKLGASWESNIHGHNTVVVDRKDPERHHHWGCKLDAGVAHAFVDAGPVQVIDVEQEPYRVTSSREDDDQEEQPSYHRPTDGRPTPKVDVYRRAVILVDVSEDDFYLLDVFRAKGGLQHHLAFHGPQGKTAVSGVRLTRQAGGTLGDPTGHFGKPYVDDLGESALDPFSMITNVRRGALQGPATIDYSTGLESGAGVRFTVLPEEGSLLEIGDGSPPANRESYKIKMAYVSRQSLPSLSNQFVLRTEENRLSSQFATLIEPRGARPVIRRARRLVGRAAPGGEFEPVCAQVERSGATDVLIAQFGYGGRMVEAGGFETDGEYAVATITRGWATRLALFGGTLARFGGAELRVDTGFLRGRIVLVDRGRKRVAIEGFPSDCRLTGARIRFHNNRHSAMYTVVSAEVGPDGKWALGLDFPSLIGAGRVEGISDGIVKTHGQMMFAGLVPEGDGSFRDRFSLYAGATMENAAGQGALRIRGVTGIISYNNVPHEVYVDREAHPEADAEWLRALYPQGTDFLIYDYGIGDQAEVMNWAVATRHADGWDAVGVTAARIGATGTPLD